MGLRQEKKDRTRTELVRAALELFDERGFEATPVRAVADAVRVSPATVYTYFPAKDDLVFPDRALYTELFVTVLGDRDPAARPWDVLVAGAEAMLRSEGWSIAPDDPLAAVRGRVVAASPALRARALVELTALQGRWATLLCRAFPSSLNPVSANALTGAAFGAIVGVVTDQLRRDDRSTADLACLVRRALADVERLVRAGPPSSARDRPP